MKKISVSTVLLLLLHALPAFVYAQVTFPVNGVAEPAQRVYVFRDATIVKDGKTTLSNADMLIRDGKIVSIGKDIDAPANAIIIDCKGKYIYPSFIDVYSDYGLPAVPTAPPYNYGAPAQLTSNIKGAYGWNQAIKSDVEAYKSFSVDDSKAKAFRANGFGTVLTHQKDGIARGTGALVTLANEKENLVVLKERASAHYSFSKGSSTQSYPTSLMGAIALLRQTYLDANWYKSNPEAEGINISLHAWNLNQQLPQVFEANDKWNVLRADRVGDEFNIQYIIKAGGNEYQRINEVKATSAKFIVPLNFPMAIDVDDPNDARFVSLPDLKHWEMAPSNPAAFEKAGISFCLTAADLRDQKEFMSNLRKAIDHGLSESKALEALTKAPAELLGVYDVVGSLEAGKLASFLITSGPIFSEKTNILHNWIQGHKYLVKEEGWTDSRGVYNLVINSAGQSSTFTIALKEKNGLNIISKDTLKGKIEQTGNLVTLSFPVVKRSSKNIRLSGVASGKTWSGTGEDTLGNKVTWTATYVRAGSSTTDSAKKKKPLIAGEVKYPFNGYGWTVPPKQQTILIKNATVWTNEKEGKVDETDVLVKDGKISKVGKGISESGALVIDGTGKHLTPGIIDEHSHIAAASINEGAQSVTSEVRIKDNLNPDDINIYRQLSGGVTSSHILHGSANTIGGQTQLIKLRWGANDTDLMFKDWPGFIKFALGENVKRSPAPQNNRYPDTRMGVEQVLADAFKRAHDYRKKVNEENGKKKGVSGQGVRRDLELEALLEILDGKRFITCHSYVQSEITAAMRVADSLGFKFNTFTHILEGYKVADKMKAHGSAASTFSDWWAYKNEVMDAIPYNATIMQRDGLNVAINSDDAEMARRLNQEAAKSVKYGGMSEEDALKMVTLNPAKMMHIEDKVGSIKVGKDADLVLWSDHPLSIYAKAEKTIVDGIVYFDRQKDMEMRKEIASERNRLIQKMLGEKKAGGATQPAQASMQIMHGCSEHHHDHGLLIQDEYNY
jgi:imidazolonepropionase-like amidohydrolase